MRSIQIRFCIVRIIFLMLHFKGLHFDELSTSTFYKCYEKLDNTEFNLWFLNLTNKYRKRHFANPLIIRGSLMSDTLGWSKHLALEDGGLEKSIDNGTYGENLWALHGIKPDFKVTITTITPIEDWYDEGEYYSYSSATYSPLTSNFTQLVWRSTDELGCGVCRSERSVYVTCRYKPKGNIVGGFRDNVLPPKIDHIPKLFVFVMAVIFMIGFIAFLGYKYLLPILNVSEEEEE